jgi:hypothetical protein
MPLRDALQQSCCFKDNRPFKPHTALCTGCFSIQPFCCCVLCTCLRHVSFHQRFVCRCCRLSMSSVGWLYMPSLTLCMHCQVDASHKRLLFCMLTMHKETCIGSIGASLCRCHFEFPLITQSTTVRAVRAGPTDSLRRCLPLPAPPQHVCCVATARAKITEKKETQPECQHSKRFQIFRTMEVRLGRSENNEWRCNSQAVGPGQ